LVNPNEVYDRPKPNGNSGVRLCASYHRYPTSRPSEYCTWPLVPGHCAVVFAVTCDSDAGNVTGSLPDGFTSPNSSAAIAVPHCWPS